ncbi:hypothetical protein QR685DRAFT_31915 [Neurospora intermedia]|uniref:Uncharacterized protein n=1 Tax=Neurospora intermedia TaxID=5142 RepID=A0ABR3DQW4_NEUIN
MQAVTTSLIRTTIRTPRIPGHNIFRKQPARTITTTPTQTANMTTGTFRYADPATINRSTTPFVKSWSKVDVDYSSFSRVSVSKPVHDLRSAVESSPSDFGVDVSGFALYTHPAKETAFTDERAIWSGYYAEVEALLREKLPGIKRVEIFDHTIRRNNGSAARRPVQQVHVDQTPAAAATRVRRHVSPPEEAEKLLKGRYQIINVWRPISHPATDFPLAFIDWRSTSPGDLVPIDLLYPKRSELEDDGDDRGKEVAPAEETYPKTEGYEVKGETYGVVPNETHKFYYVKDMKPEEVVLIKCFDSWGEGLEEPWGKGKKGVAGWTPHTAFVDPATPEGTPGRESIEVRCLVFYEDEE